ncbi:MAG TPA: cyclic nucleotide-binding domain-containing protein [Thermodesulfovibrionales bacterium]|nr:cyclic nucleotide-binding domain-containing protein [Thermodesulfovibrionales bacterium]
MKEGELGKVYAGGEIIFNEGSVGDVMYVIQSGKVKITKKTESEEVTIAILGEGEIFGEMAVFDRLPRSATAVALGDARVLSVDKKKLFTTINRDPTLVFKMMESMSERIRRLDGELAELKKEHTEMSRICVDVDETSALILKEAKHVIPAENGSLMLLDNEGKSLVIAAAFGEEADPKVTLSVGAGIAGDVLRTGKAELVNNVSLDSRFVPGGSQITSILCAPLRCRDYNFGVINMSNRSDTPFSLDDLKMLDALTLYASIAIQNAKNFSQLKDATNEVLRHATMLYMS